MGVFVVERGTGAGYDAARDRRQQEQWDEHAAFMDALVDDGFVVLGGEDPWEPLKILSVERITPWTLWLDARKGRPRE